MVSVELQARRCVHRHAHLLQPPEAPLKALQKRLEMMGLKTPLPHVLRTRAETSEVWLEEWLGENLDGEDGLQGGVAARRASLLRRIATHSPFEGLSGSSCAVVGNSGVLLGRGHGPDIDRHDVVLRVNSPPLDGHIADVGRRTTVTTLNPSQYTWPWRGHTSWLDRMDHQGRPAVVLTMCSYGAPSSRRSRGVTLLWRATTPTLLETSRSMCGTTASLTLQKAGGGRLVYRGSALRQER